MSTPEDIHVVVPTHTTRHLALTLAALARQSARPATVTVSCDTDDDGIGEVTARWAHAIGATSGVYWVRRPHLGGERLCQVRNNAVRHLSRELSIDRGRVLIVDGDMVLHDDALRRHADIARDRRAALVLPYRIDLGPQRTDALDADRYADAAEPLGLSADERAILARRDRRYRRHLLSRSLRLGPRHKPKLLGGHVSIDLPLYLRLNGFDELYQGWGFKDDEFAERAARLRARAEPACLAIPAWHLFHRTRQPDRPMRELPTARRFAMRRSLPTACAHGVRNPLDQPGPEVTRLG